ncbi:MAG: ferredoxin [Desulfitobacterium sp.]
MIAKVNREGCIGCGACESVCPKVFEMDEEAGAQEATDGCPVEAITLE